MKLLVIRHGIAEDAPPGGADADRRLTESGIRKMGRGARGLHRVVPSIDLLASSPLVRAVETARIVSDAYDGLEVVETPSLSPGSPPEAVAAWLIRQRGVEVAAIVGHEPGLSVLVSWLLSGELRSAIELKKGAACLVDCPGELVGGSGTLLWALRPGQLRRLK